MADEKKKEEEGEEGKKKGLPAIVLVAVGAIVGGAGAVFAIPPKQVEVEHVEPELEMLDVQHPDLFEFQFNPRTQAGKAYVSANFYFVYRVREDLEEEAFELIKAHWDQAVHSILLLFRARTIAELNSANGHEILAKDIAAELDAALFGGSPDHKVATVTEVLWSKLIVQ